MAGGIIKYPPVGSGVIANYPLNPPTPPSNPPAPPATPPAPPTTGVVVQPNPGINNNLDAQIYYSNMRVGYFKIDLINTKSNIYGESLEKWYYPPINVKCLIERGVITNTDTEFGVDVNQTITVTISKTEFETTYNFVPEVGDIISDQERYYEVSSVDRQTVTIPGGQGSNPNPAPGNTPNQIILYVLSAYLTRTSKLNIVKYST